MDTNAYYCEYGSVFVFPHCDEVYKRTNSRSWSIGIRDLYEHFAKVHEGDNPQFAARLLESASHWPHINEHPYMPFERDGRGNILPDCDDWDELTDEEKLVRGNRLAAIAILDRLRFDLESRDDTPVEADRITSIRRGLAEMAFE
ncbi:hypothetical protein [Mesorhizobium sp. ES1-3]|uniref:hypothetical protein n=1 Tax=Mesorhizobium sp. ES1-3 TaxID=2876628 RepID=UPI001CCEB88F|nr:hypothetical protein [Mesorhizobium sp. ES1-3]MBZ9673315.1 hypothetical protein [Mesorhizobium sp. ES1-3]